MTEKSGVGGEIDLPPGFRFFPTDEELVVHYLCKKVVSHPLPAFIIGEVDLYKYDPWQLPEKALFGEKEWYFFTPRDRKYPNGSRPNRAAGSGYWKATGADKPITTCGGRKRVGVKKALVFYKGKAPKGSKTNWIMHEYRMAEINMAARKMNTLRLDDWVLCRIYNKKSSAEKLEEKKLAEDRQEMEEAIEQQKNRQTVHLEAPRSEATVSAEGGVPSSSSSILISQLPAAMNLSPAPHNPFYHQQSTDINRSYSIGAETRNSPNPDSAATPLQYNRLNSISMTERTKAMKPGLVTSAPNPDEVQTNMKLPNQLIQKQQTGQSFNFNLGLDGLQSPFFQMDHTEPPSLYNPYQEFIDSYNIQRSY